MDCEQAEQIERIGRYEAMLDELTDRVRTAEDALAALEAARPELEALRAYYESPVWMRDFTDDEAGCLPRDLKRGVLSEDAVFDLLERAQALLQ